MRCSFVLVLVFLLGTRVFSQKVENIKAEFKEGKVTITYDLINGQASRLYDIHLYSSHNSFASALTNVSGDVGQNIKAGMGKKITWDAVTELVDFKGDLNFKITGEMMPLPWSIKTPAANASVRRGKKTMITWEGGKPTETIKLELYRGPELISVLPETKNTGKHEWSVPRKQSKGTYVLKLNVGGKPVSSAEFKIKSKTPFIVKALPFVAIGVVLLTLPDDSGGSGDLPYAPDPQSK